MSKCKQVGLLAVVLSLASMMGTAAELLDTRPECQKADEWVQGHLKDLPSTLDSLQSFEPDYRVRIFAALPPEQKAQIWHARLQQVLRRPLTDAQRGVVEEAMAIVSPALYEGGTGFPVAWRSEVRQQFARAEAAEMFESLGPSPSGALQPKCNCNDNSECTPPHECDDTIDCTTTAFGCGPGGADQCSEHCN